MNDQRPDPSETRLLMNDQRPDPSDTRRSLHCCYGRSISYDLFGWRTFKCGSCCTHDNNPDSALDYGSNAKQID